MGRVKSYHDELRCSLSCFQTITMSADLCSVTTKGGVSNRLWIKEGIDGDIFYGESELDIRKGRIITHTDTAHAVQNAAPNKHGI